MKDKDILEMLKEETDKVARQLLRGVIIQPGAIGDCILTLPLARFMKNNLSFGGVDMIGHTEYIGILPGRSCVDSVRSIDSIELHRLFDKPKSFELADKDVLINVFADYSWIVTFMGEPHSNFERNLIFTAHCSHSAEVITLELKPARNFRGHITQHHTEQFVKQSNMSVSIRQSELNKCLIRTTDEDLCRGRELLEENGIDFCKKLVVIAPGSGGMHKCWHIENFLSLAQKLRLRNFEVVFLLGPAELERFPGDLIENICCTGQCFTDLSLTMICGLLSCAHAFIGNDSGITHLAAASGVKTVAVFGPTNPAIYRPVGPSVIVFESDATVFAKESSIQLQQKILDVLLC